MPIKARSLDDAAGLLVGSSAVAGALAARGWRETLRAHWPEYAMEGTLLGAFMIAAGAVGTLLEHPGSTLHAILPVPFLRRVLAGLLMGLTAMGLVHSPWGKRSGAHMNPSLTLTFLRLGKVAPWDAAFYVFAQFVGGFAGILAARIAIGPMLAHRSVNYVATIPGPAGPAAAWVAESAISFVLMLVVLGSSNSLRLSRRTPLFVGVLIALFITLESPLSGMSMNPARSLGPALPARALRSLWVYFTAPPVGMLLAAEVFLRIRGARAVWCAKLHHDSEERCIFHCTRAAHVAALGSRPPESREPRVESREPDLPRAQSRGPRAV